MKEIQIKGKKLKVEWDSESVYRFSKAGGNPDELAAVEKGAAIGKATAFANAVLLTWAMLRDNSRDEFPAPEKLATLFWPTFPDVSVMDELGTVIADGNKVVNA